MHASDESTQRAEIYEPCGENCWHQAEAFTLSSPPVPDFAPLHLLACSRLRLLFPQDWGADHVPTATMPGREYPGLEDLCRCECASERPCSLPCCDARGQCARVASTRWGEFNDQHSIIYAPNVDVWINSLLRAAPDDPSEKGHSSILPRTRPETPLTLTLILSETRNAPAPACRCRTATALDAHGSTTRHDGGKIEGLRTE